MKTLNFTSGKKHIYHLLYSAIIAAPIKGVGDIAKARKALKSLETVGKLSDNPEEKELGLYELVQDATLEMEDAHFNYMKTKFEETQWVSSRKLDELNDVVDFLDEVSKAK